MKTNRYINQPAQYQPKSRSVFDKLSKLKSQPEKATLKSLLETYNQHQNYNLSCNKQLGLYITPIFQISKLTKVKSKGQLAVKVGTLKELFRKYLIQPKKAIVFKATAYKHIQHVVQSDHQIIKNQFSLCKTTYQAQRDSNIVSQESNRKNSFNNKNGVQSYIKEKWTSNEYKKDFVDNNKLTTVEQVKQSSQSQAQQSEREQQKKQTKYNFSEVHSNFKLNKNIVKKQQQPNKKVTHQHSQPKDPVIQRKPLQSLPNMNFENKKNNQQIQQKKVDPKISNNQKNSFGVQIRRGLIQNDSFEPNYENSLRVAGDREIEKELNNRLSSNEASQISQLSSIISTGLHQAYNGQPLNHSLKNEIAIIDYESRGQAQKKNQQKEVTFCKRQNRQMQPAIAPYQQKVQKINLRMMTQKREQQVNDNIEITQKQNGQQHEFSVKYNLRFLDKKNVGAEVVRLSPLRFRGKQAMQIGKVEVLGQQNKAKTQIS